MPERDDHWDFLAADLGAVPQQPEETADEEPTEVEPESEVPADSTVSDDSTESAVSEEEPGLDRDASARPAARPKRRAGAGRGDRVVSGFGYRRGAVDWANLARELGVEPMEEVPEPIPAGEEPVEIAAADAAETDPPVVEEVVEETVVAEFVETVVEPAPPASDSVGEGFGAGLLEDVEPEAERPAADDDEGDEPREERKGRRRRRRRKPKKPELEQEQLDEQPDTAEVDSVAEDDEEADLPTPAEELESDEERPRRRGRRRGGRKRGARDKKAADTDGFGVGLDADEVVVGEEADELAVIDLDEDEEADQPVAAKSDSDRQRGPDDERKGKKTAKKVSHRGIPSWQEAVGYLIDSNLENRSKRPESSGSRQRSGRRRGGDRSGNRNRS